jgi:uncharacterized protein (UPF0548 family)
VIYRLLGHAREPRSVADLRDRPLNFDPGRIAEYRSDAGWHHDDYRQALPTEPPGEPVPGGSFEVAMRLMRDYAFAEGSAIKAVFERDGALEGRDMLLRAKILGLRFNLGVRVGEVVDRLDQVDGRPVRIWGWNYRTLDGHLERGEMEYDVWKWLDTGEVEFRIAAVSRRAQIANPLLRLGVILFARREQLKFYRHVCDRMARIVPTELARGV